MIWLILLRLIFEQVFVTSGMPTIVTLNGDARPVNLVYSAAEGEQITVIARSLDDEPIDITLEILKDEQRIAFNDDQNTDREGLSTQDSAIENLVLATAGDYTIRVNSFNGAQSGDIEVTIEQIPLAEPCEMPLQVGKLARNGSFFCTFTVDSGTKMTITARDISGTLDPVLTVLDSRSERVAYNDDHSSVNLTLNTLDAQISDLTLSAGESYTVQVIDFSGAAGTFELSFEITP